LDGIGSKKKLAAVVLRGEEMADIRDIVTVTLDIFDEGFAQISCIPLYLSIGPSEVGSKLLTTYKL
jgi:hypothetical protein